MMGKTVVITGGGGVLCSFLAKALAQAGANAAILDISLESAERVAGEIQAGGGQAMALACDVLNRSSVEKAQQAVIEKFGQVDYLINGAGGNKPQATSSAAKSFFDLPADILEKVFSLNLMGTIIPSQVFGRGMAERNEGAILNISSMSAFRPLTHVSAYSAAKAGVSNFTQWLAVHLAQEYSPNIRVNAIAPGFFLTEQNRFLLTETQSGNLTQRGQQILTHTPAGRFGTPDDLVEAVMFLLSPGAGFITGVVLPIDGGFSAFAGV